METAAPTSTSPATRARMRCTTTSCGAGLSCGGRPADTGADVAPTLKMASIKAVTTVAPTSIVVEPMHLQACDHSSPNEWLTSQAVTKSLPQGVSVAKITESID